MSKNLPVDQESLTLKKPCKQESKEASVKSNLVKHKDIESLNIDPQVLKQPGQGLLEHIRQGSFEEENVPLTRDLKTEESSSSEEQEEGELEELEEGSNQEDRDEKEDDDVALLTKQITRVPRRDPKLHPKKRIALTTEAQRQQHSQRDHTQRHEKRQVASSSEEDDEYISDEAEDEDRDRESGQRRRHSSLSSGSRRRVYKEEKPINVEEFLRDLKETSNPVKLVSRLIEFTNEISLSRKGHEMSRASLDALYREWLPKYGAVLLARSYPELGYPHGTTVAVKIQEYLNKLLEIAIHLLQDPEGMGVNKDDFPLSELMMEAVSRIIGDENASFYRRFDGRGDGGRRLDVTNTLVEYEENTNEMIGLEQLEPHASQYQINCIKFFVAKGGLQAVLGALERVEIVNEQKNEHYPSNIDLKDINGLIRIIWKLGPFVANGMCGGNMDFRLFALSVATCVQGRIREIPDETLHRYDKKLVITMIHMVAQMIMSCPSTIHVPMSLRDERQNYHPMLSSDDEDDEDEETEFMHYQDIPDEQQILTCCCLRLDVASRLLRAFRLDLRLAGLSEIKDILHYGFKQAKIIRRTKKKSNSRKRSLSIDGEDESHLTEEESSIRIIRKLVEKLREQEILEYIFGPNIHLEIVQRSTDVLLFLIHAGELTSLDLDKIWIPVAGSQHQSIVHGVFQVLNDISDQLSLEHREYLFKKLNILPINAYETQTYLLIKQLILSMVENAHSPVRGTMAVNEISYEAHLLLWRILRDSSLSLTALMNAEVLTPTSASSVSTLNLIDQDIIQGVNQLLNNVLQYGLSEEKRQELLQMCIDDLRAHHPATVWALRVIMRIINTPPFPTTSTPSDYLRHLIAQVGLPNLFLEDLTHWTTTIKSLTDRRGSMTSMEIDQMPPIGLSSPLIGLSPTRVAILKDQLLGRLQFLQWMGNCETVPFFTSTSQTDIVWDCLVANPIGIPERDEAFICLENITEYDHFINHFFHNRMPQLDVRYFSEQALKYAKSCLLKVNAKLRRVRMIPSSQQIFLQGDLIDCELLWNIALSAEVEAVGKEAIAFLVHLYMNTDPTMQDSISLAQKHREILVDKCVSHLFAAASGLSPIFSAEKDHDLLVSKNIPSNNDPLLSINKVAEASMFKRCLEMLKYFMDYFDTKYLSSKSSQTLVRRHGMLNDGKIITIKVKITQGSDTKEMEFPMHTSETILGLRHKISAKIKLSQPGVLRLISSGKEFSPDSNSMTLQELKINDGAVFIGQRRITDSNGSQDIDKTDSIPEEEMKDLDLPTNLLSKYVDKFFVMLQLEEEYAAQIWDFLMRLPTNRTMLSSLKSLGAPVDWNSLIDSRSPFRLLYSLQIVDWLLRGGDETLNAAGWGQRFLKNGGHDHLLAVLIKRDQPLIEPQTATRDHQKSMIKRACLGLLLKVIDFFVNDHNFANVEFFNHIDKRDLLTKLLDIMEKCFDPGLKQIDEDLLIIKYANKLLYCLCMRDEFSLKCLCDYSGLNEWILKALVKCQSEDARKDIADMITKFCGQDDLESGLIKTSLHSHSLEFFLPLLVSLLPQLEQHIFTSKEYFDLLGNLLSILPNSTKFNVNQFFTSLIQHIKQHPIKEMSHINEFLILSPQQPNTGIDDTVIIGLIKIATIMVKKYPEFKRTPHFGDRFIDMIFYDCLFEIPTMEFSGSSLVPPKCKLSESRTAAMELLIELVKDCPENFVHLTDLLLKQLDRGDQLNDNWNYCPQSCTKASSGYVGLQNLGATCYVNSIVQQFFMNPSFRNGIFSAPVRDENKDESLLYQLQVVFGHLQESQKKSYEATSFCLAYKEHDAPMNVAVQMDVDEYFNGLVECLENSVSGTSQAMLFKNHFGGTLVQQVKSRECEHVSEREDPIFAIQCEVKNKKNVEESLQLYVEGEILDGDNKYFCDKCDMKVDAIKRVCIKNLPNNLILHLKRFDFDMETFKRVKINEQFEFPDHINMEPYTLDYLTKKESGLLEETSADEVNKPQYEYQLVGVLVHTGTADSGHYYSFIKERKALHSDPSGEQKWYQFNDSNVESFNPKDIPKCCYGGFDYMSNWDPNTQKNVTRAFAKPYSAYMLFYERCCEELKNENLQSPIEKDPVSKVPEDIYSAIWQENIGFLQDKNIFDVGYFRLLWNVIHSMDIETQNQISTRTVNIDLTFRTIQLASEFVLGTLSRAKDNLELNKWIDFLKTLFQSNLNSCRWFIQRFIDKHPNYIQQLLMSCYVQDVREHIVDLVLFALKVLRHGDPAAYGFIKSDMGADETQHFEMSIDPDSDILFISHPEGLIVQLCEELFSLLPSAYLWWRNFDQYFYLLSQIANFGLPERIYMIQCGLVGELVELFLLDETSPPKGRKRRMGDKFSLPPFRYLLLTLRILLTACDVRNLDQEDDILVTEHYSRFKLRQKELELILQRNASDDEYIFFLKQIRDGVDIQISREIFTHFATNNQHFSEEFISQLVRAADSYTAEHHVKPHLEIIYFLTQIKDPLYEIRIGHSIQGILKLSKSHQTTPQISFECLRFIEALITSDYGAFVRKLLVTYLDQWLPDFLLGNLYENIRQQAENMCDLLIFNYLKEAEDEKAKKEALESVRKLYDVLVKCIDNVEAYWKTTFPRREAYGWRLSNFFRVLTKCVQSPKEKKSFLPYFERFSTCLITIDTQRVDCDMDKKEMFNFWYQVCEGCPENVNLFISNPNIYDHLHMFYVSINHLPENIAYNQATLPKYYGIILMGCRQSPEYHSVWMEAANFSWALNSMIWGDFYEDHKTDELQELVKISADRSAQFRMKCWDTALIGNVNSPLLRKIPLCLRLHTFLYRDSVDDLLIFCKYLGLDTFSQYIGAVRDKNSNDENLFQCLDALHCYFKVAASASSDSEALQVYFKAWSNSKVFALTLLSFLHPNTENQIYIRATEILSIMLEIEFTRNITSEVLDCLIKSHTQWQKKMARIDDEDLLAAFGGNRSLYTKFQLLDKKTPGPSALKALLNLPSVHVYKPFLKNLQSSEKQLLQEELYTPYLTVVRHAILGGIELQEFDKVVQLCTLVITEMMGFQDGCVFKILLELYEKLVEYLLNSPLLLDVPSGKLDALKSLTQLVKKNKADVVQPIISRYIHQLAAHVKMLKERLKANDLHGSGSIISQLIVVLEVLNMALTADDFMSSEDPLKKAYLDCLEDLDGEFIKTWLSKLENSSNFSERLLSLVEKLRSQTINFAGNNPISSTNKDIVNTQVEDTL
ncbi:hypothetical protein G9A89_014673 [Geosiphon pyriformis]|nr:hypothetical protein G9A89_014673 [Geosiphon pyriformis]